METCFFHKIKKRDCDFLFVNIIYKFWHFCCNSDFFSQYCKKKVIIARDKLWTVRYTQICEEESENWEIIDNCDVNLEFKEKSQNLRKKSELQDMN